MKPRDLWRGLLRRPRPSPAAAPSGPLAGVGAAPVGADDPVSADLVLIDRSELGQLRRHLWETEQAHTVEAKARVQAETERDTLARRVRLLSDPRNADARYWRRLYLQEVETCRRLDDLLAWRDHRPIQLPLTAQLVSAARRDDRDELAALLAAALHPGPEAR